jgi:hypothetical protein
MRSLFAFFCSAVALLAADRPPFFAMDTAARLEPAECAQVLADLGYAGLGGRPASAKAHAAALQSKGLVFFNGYHVTNFGYGQTELPADLAKAVDDLAGTGSTLWLGINKVAFPAGVRAGPEYGDTIVVPQLKQLLLAAVDADPAKRPNAVELLAGVAAAMTCNRKAVPLQPARSLTPLPFRPSRR